MENIQDDTKKCIHLTVDQEKWFQKIPDNARPTRATATVEGEKVVKKESVLVIERARLETRKNFFAIRAAKEWNKLPELVKNRSSVNAFKAAYDKWRSSQPLTEDDDTD